MNVGAVGAVGSGAAPVYALLSPYLNGVIRTSDAAAAAQLQSAAAATSAAATQTAIAARQTAAAAITAAPPFVNPAITAIGQRIALGESLIPPAAVTPDALLGASSLTSTAAQTPLAAATAADATAGTTETAAPAPQAQPQPTSPTDQVLHGDSGTLIQSYGAVALIAGSQTPASVYTQPVTPAIPAAALVAPAPRVERVA